MKHYRLFKSTDGSCAFQKIVSGCVEGSLIQFPVLDVRANLTNGQMCWVQGIFSTALWYHILG